jgi:hypothetical protein
MIRIHAHKILIDRFGDSLGRAHNGRIESFLSVSGLQFLDVDLMHLKHCFHDSFGLFGILIVQHVDQHSWGDLPGQTEFVLEPTALRIPHRHRQ